MTFLEWAATPLGTMVGWLSIAIIGFPLYYWKMKDDALHAEDEVKEQ